MAGGEKIEKSVNFTDVPANGDILNLWQNESVDYTVLSHYFEKKTPSQPLSQNPQTKSFVINVEPSKHFTLLRASYLTFEMRLCQLDEKHSKLPPITPPKLQKTSVVTSHEDASHERNPANGRARAENISQSEARKKGLLVQHHHTNGNTFVLDNEHEKQKRTNNMEHDMRHDMRQRSNEMEDRKKRERMERWINEQQNHQRKRKMIRDSEQSSKRPRIQSEYRNDQSRKRKHSASTSSSTSNSTSSTTTDTSQISRKRKKTRCDNREQTQRTHRSCHEAPTKPLGIPRDHDLRGPRGDDVGAPKGPLGADFVGANTDNAPGTLVFSDIDLRINGSSVTSLYSTYHITSWLLLLGYSSDARSCKWESLLW